MLPLYTDLTTNKIAQNYADYLLGNDHNPEFYENM